MSFKIFPLNYFDNGPFNHVGDGPSVSSLALPWPTTQPRGLYGTIAGLVWVLIWVGLLEIPSTSTTSPSSAPPSLPSLPTPSSHVKRQQSVPRQEFLINMVPCCPIPPRPPPSSGRGCQSDSIDSSSSVTALPGTYHAYCPMTSTMQPPHHPCGDTRLVDSASLCLHHHVIRYSKHRYWLHQRSPVLYFYFFGKDADATAWWVVLLLVVSILVHGCAKRATFSS